MLTWSFLCVLASLGSLCVIKSPLLRMTPSNQVRAHPPSSPVLNLITFSKALSLNASPAVLGVQGSIYGLGENSVQPTRVEKVSWRETGV